MSEAVVNLVKAQFTRAAIGIQKIIADDRYEKSFDNFLVEVTCDLGLLRIVRDRGRIYVDIFDEHARRYVSSLERYSQIFEIYQSDVVELWEVLNILKKMVLPK